MAYYAFVDSNNKVVSVISGRNEDEVVEGISDWEAYYSSKRPGLTALRTSCNTYGGVHYDPDTREPSADQNKAFRFNFAGLGYTFDSNKGTDGAFIPPQPGPDCTLDEDTCLWVCPEEDVTDETA